MPGAEFCGVPDNLPSCGEDQIATVELAPGENVTGAVTGKGSWTAKSVAYTDGLIGKSVRVDVS
ncbi:hypothetical protein [Streptomyces erythrochromogenes]|uniref:hypothetical protein n=1 Tax=Streptomyces erythrochromogenes TaxID=285574 RepID=UPI00225739D4|nr:hypothetical protein [Streptomyces erythrochromogenes]MCX5583605.1 hypothetical protein [Streptomyces erythrochromogenes]